MTSLIEDWKSFCSGQADYDKSHFLTLFHEDHDDFELAQIFEHFPNADKLTANVRRFREAWHHRNKREKRLSEAGACEVAMLDLQEKAIAFVEFGEDELTAIVDSAQPVVTRSVSEFESAARAEWPNREKQIILGDYFDEKWQSFDKKMDALMEAFYGAANSYDLQWYLASPLLNTSINFEPYLLLWEAGLDTALTEDHLLILEPSSGG